MQLWTRFKNFNVVTWAEWYNWVCVFSVCASCLTSHSTVFQWCTLVLMLQGAQFFFKALSCTTDTPNPLIP